MVEKIETNGNPLELGETINDVIITKLNRPGSIEHDTAVKRLINIVANNPGALTELERTQS